MSDQEAKFVELVSKLDDNEKAALLFTIQATDKLKSQAAIDRRMNEFREWRKGYRAKKSLQQEVNA